MEQGWHPNTELGVDVKTLLRSDVRLKTGKEYPGVLRRDSDAVVDDFLCRDAHYTFIESTALSTAERRNVRLYEQSPDWKGTGNREQGTGNRERGTVKPSNRQAKKGTGNGERGTDHGERGTVKPSNRQTKKGTGNGEQRTRNGERGTVNQRCDGATTRRCNE